ncbi:MAG TPA: peptidylprolyl isomerase [Polyangiaceae bacterium]|nr:peptidylprolyl isomerase [Polyangiaceae bacterium]HNZ22670.1 peptidylprolyl isomerase [Polyangiaceae bacterium]HOD21564.1 peptidylprolyl isomerase [Polyangiaceae bacterium]HOE49286.1 peptidylprolyl isomerase [Polyangiaceae bacterium]HOH00339.1 peptidylprolyl isomerase [Polyangiaceae bacterium]
MSFVYGGIVLAIAMVFIVQFRPGSGRETASLTRQCAVTIRDRCIEPKEFLASLGLAAPRGADDDRLRAMQIRRQVAEGLIERTLLVQDAKRLAMTVSDDEINAELVKGRFHVSLPQARRDIAYYLRLQEEGAEGVRLLDVTSPETGKFDYKVYTRVVRNTTNRSPSEFKEMQREEIIAERMRQLIASRASITDTEAFDVYQREKSSAKLEVVRLDRDYFAAKYIDTSEKAVESWAKEHTKDIDDSWNARKSSFPAGCVKARHILVKVQSTTVPQGHPREEAQSLIEKARSRIAGGELFPVVASSMSEDSASADKGGDLGCIVKGKYPQAFDDAVFSQKKPGLIDTVIETNYGFHLVDIEMIVSENAQTAEAQGRMQIAKELMLAVETEKLISETAKHIQESAQKGTALQQAIDTVLAKLDEERGIKKKAAKKEEEETPTEPGRPFIETTASFSQLDGNPIDGVARGQNVVEMAFRLSKPGEVGSDLVRLNNGYAVIQLKERTSASREDFDKERHEYAARLLYVKQQDLLVSYIEQLRKAAEKEITIAEKWVQEPKRRSGSDDDE